MFRTLNTQRGAIGFTITEIMVVTIIMGIASAVVIPQFGGNTTQYAQTAATTITQTFQYAQDLAVTTQSPVTVSISDSGHVFTLKNNLGATLTHPIDHQLFIVSLRDESSTSGLTITPGFNNIDDVVFDAFGAPTTGGTITISHSKMPLDMVVTLHPATGSISAELTRNP
jgi:type II secretion system protein H